MGAETFIQRCKQQWPYIPCITLVDSPRQIRPAIEAGADTTLLIGFTIAQLLEHIDHLLLQQRLLTGEQATI
jgi:nicotinate-nucleotide pyrophosphorylase